MKHNLHQYNEKIKEMIEAGKLKKEIAYALKMDCGRVNEHIETWFTVTKTATYKVKTQKSQVLKDNEAEVMRLFRSGVTPKEIAEKYKCEYQPTYSFIQFRKNKKYEHSQA